MRRYEKKTRELYDFCRKHISDYHRYSNSFKSKRIQQWWHYYHCESERIWRRKFKYVLIDIEEFEFDNSEESD